MQFTLNMLSNHGSHQDWKTWKNGKAFSSEGILLRLEKSGNFTQNTGKIRKKLYWEIEKSTEKVGEIYQPVIVKAQQICMVPYFKKGHIKKYWKTVKNTGKVREICQSEKVATMQIVLPNIVH